MQKESNLELKVGGFVLLSFIGLTYFIFSISGFSAFQQGKTLQVIFGFANGVKKSAPVRFAGVDAGIVKEIEVFYDRKDNKSKVKVDLWLQGEIEVPADSKVFVNQLGLLGEKYIEIMPGVANDRLLGNGSVITGEDPIPVEHLSKMITDIAAKVEDGVDGINSIVRNEKNQESIQTTLAGLSSIVTNVKDGKGTVGKLFYDESLYTDLNEMTSDLKLNPWKLLYRPKGLK